MKKTKIKHYSIFSQLSHQDFWLGFFIIVATLSFTQIIDWNKNESFHASLIREEQIEKLEAKVNKLEQKLRGETESF